MADYQAVALGIKPADPGQAFDSINSILGMQQKRQGLQIQAQQLQQEQLKTEGQQGAAQYFQDFDPTQWVTANGTTDVNGIMAGDAKFKGLNGVAKPIVMDQLQKMQGHQLENMRTLGQMDSETVSDFAQRANTWALNPEVQKGSAEGGKYLQDEIQKYGLLDPQKAKIAQIYGKPFTAPSGQGGVKPEHYVDALHAMGAQAQTVSEQQPKPTSFDTGGQILPATIAPTTGKPTLTGQAIEKTTPPQLLTNATGQIVRASPGGGGVAVVPGQPNANPTQAEATAQRGQAEAVTGRVSQVLNQAGNTVQAQDALSRAKAILESSESPDTGAGFEKKKFLKNAMSSLGIDTQGADDMNTLAKNLARYEASRATASGLGGTDAARELAHNGSPNTALDNKALLGIVRQSLATEKALSGYAKVQSSSNDPQTLLKNETAFRAIPHPIETYEYMMSRNKGEADKYLKEHGLTHESITKSAAMLKSFGAL